MCLSGNKSNDQHVAEALNRLTDTMYFQIQPQRPGYTGTAIISKSSSLSLTNGIGIPEHGTEGRVMCLETDRFYLGQCLVPNSGFE